MRACTYICPAAIGVSTTVASDRCRSPLEPLIYVEPPRLGRIPLAIKRVIDVVASIVGLVLVSPVLAAAAAAVKLSDGGPVIYRQRRIGRDGLDFTMLKLRTMVVGADELEPPPERERRAAVQEFGPRSAGDEGGPLPAGLIHRRVPPVHQRDTRRDEPRWPSSGAAGRSRAVRRRLLERHSIRPGVTGLWQVEARDHGSFEAYRRLDLYYLDNWSPLLDLAIMQPHRSARDRAFAPPTPRSVQRRVRPPPVRPSRRAGGPEGALSFVFVSRTRSGSGPMPAVV